MKILSQNGMVCVLMFLRIDKNGGLNLVMRPRQDIIDGYENCINYWIVLYGTSIDS